MSRAFVKDDDQRPERAPARPIDADRPNYVTPGGLRLLREALSRARAESDERNAAYFEARIGSAVVVEQSGAAGEIAFGSSVELHDEDGRRLRVRIVGEDEADPARGDISWISPYAQALLGRRAGERVVVQRPAGPQAVVIDAVGEGSGGDLRESPPEP